MCSHNNIAVMQNIMQYNNKTNPHWIKYNKSITQIKSNGNSARNKFKQDHIFRNNVMRMSTKSYYYGEYKRTISDNHYYDDIRAMLFQCEIMPTQFIRRQLRYRQHTQGLLMTKYELTKKK